MPEPTALITVGSVAEVLGLSTKQASRVMDAIAVRTTSGERLITGAQLAELVAQRAARAARKESAQR